MTENAAKRALRLLDLVPYLNANQGATVRQVSERFEITDEEVIKDLDLISMCGLLGFTPLELIDISHEDGIITVRNPQNLDLPRNFNEEEVLLLQIALSALENLLPSERRSFIRNLRGKLRLEFRSDFPEAAFAYHGDVDDRKLRLIQSALTSNHKLKITYLNLAKDEVTTRTISPLRIIAETKRTLIEAYCETARAIRTFNLSQIQELIELDEASESSVADSNPDFLLAEIAAFPESEFVRQNGDEMTKLGNDQYAIKIFQEDWIIRSVLAAGGAVKVLKPLELKRAISRFAASALENYT